MILLLHPSSSAASTQRRYARYFAFTNSTHPAMHRQLQTRRAGFRALAVVVALATLALVVRPSAGRTLPRSVATPAGAVRTTLQGGIIVQVRDFPGSGTLDVIAWNSAEPTYGVRTFVRRSGAPDRYHRLWVNVDVAGVREVTKAEGLNRPLRVSTETDTQNCFNGKCSPTSTVGARLPDDAFRASTGDVLVKFITPSSSELNFTLRRGLVDSYLATVDSVAKALKK
jgi:hypothetical protein